MITKTGVKLLELELEKADAKIEALTNKLWEIEQWCGAYPLDIFPEPDLKKVAELLEAGGITIDSVSASSMRHVLNGIKKIIERADE